MSEKILVTGGAGFIGSHLCDRLLKEGTSIICVDNLTPYYPPKVKLDNIKQNLENPNFHFFAIDIENRLQLEQIFKNNKINVVVHLAARAGVRPSIENPLGYKDTNISGTLNLLELSKKYGIKNFIFGSSSSVYGNSKKIPFSETDNVDYPISPYAASKKSCELYCYTYSHLCDMNVTCLRFFTVYGPRGRPDMAPYLFTKWVSEGTTLTKFGNGESKRDYTYISDIIEGIMKCLKKHFKFEIFNLGNSRTVELSYFISLIERLVGKKAKIKQLKRPPGDVDITFADISKAKRLLNWEPKVPIEEGMRKFIEWYK